MVSINTTGLASGEEITAGVFLTPFGELEAAINDLIDGTEGFTAINVDGGAIDGTAIGAGTASTGAFTTLTATDGSGVQALNGSNVTSGTVAAARVGSLPASKITTGTIDAARLPDRTLADITDAGTIASQDANAVNIDGGAIDGTAIGATTASTGAFTTLTATGTTTITTIDCNGGAIDGTVIGANSATTANFTTATATFFDINAGGQIRFRDGSATLRGQLAYEFSAPNDIVFNNYSAAGAYITTLLRLSTDSAELGFFNTATVAKPTVTGSRGGNAALASLLTALANLGLITNSTTA